MKKIKLILFVLTLALLTVFAVGCGADGDKRLEGKNVVTFDMNGGIMKYGTSSTDGKINFAYNPGTKILDPSSEIPNYEIYRTGYNFTGWYTSAECEDGDEWNFNTLFNTESLTLYAGWERAVKHTFDVCYLDSEGNPVILGSRETSEGSKISEVMVKNLAKRTNFTPVGYYADAELTTPWDFANMTHPGGESDRSVLIYVKYIEGEWSLVDTLTAFKAAVSGNKNIYLTADIDCGGAELSFKGSFGGEINGNSYAISNFTVKASEGTFSTRDCAIFTTLESSAKIKNIDFLNVSYVINAHESYLDTTAVRFATIALSANGATISNVTVSGTLTTNYTGTLPDVSSAVFGDSTAVTEDYTADVTVNR